MRELELLEWVHDHRGDLEEISVRHDTDEHVVRGLTVMVLSGYSDEEVFADLGHEILVFDGQCNPLHDTPEILTEIRRLVAES